MFDLDTSTANTFGDVETDFKEDSFLPLPGGSGSGPVGIVDGKVGDVEINTPQGREITKVTIEFTAALPDGVLEGFVNPGATLVGGKIAVSYTATKIELTVAALQTADANDFGQAIQLIQYDNDDDQPNETDRTVRVTVEHERTLS